MDGLTRLLDRSVAVRLVITSVFWSLLILVTAGVVLTALYRAQAERAFDERLHVYLKAIVADVAASPDSASVQPASLGESRFDLPLSGYYWQILRVEGDRAIETGIRTSKSLFSYRLPRLSELGIPTRVGGVAEGNAAGPDDRPIRIIERLIDLGEDGRYLIAVAGDRQEVEDNTRAFVLAVVATFAALGIALALSSIAQVRFGLHPLKRMRQEIGAIRRGESARVQGTYPRELTPIAEELNQLVDANHEIIERARTHVGNLAHALKTPLSVMVNEAAEEASPLADKVREQTLIMRDQVQYYLDRARAAARAAAVGSVTEVDPVVEGLVRTFRKITRDQGTTFSVEGVAGTRFRGERQDLEEMVGNLVDNAAKWARSEVRVSVREEEPLAPGRPAIAIVIEDDGPGLPAAARAEATRRGRRLDESKPGSGLGLSIVVDLAQLYGGAFVLEDGDRGGLRAILRLPSVELSGA